MDKLISMQAFTEVVASGGFAAAARKMGLSRSAVNKMVISLENELQVQLLQRSTRKVNPTPTGLVYYEYCLNILAEVTAAENAVSQLQQQPKGTLKINAPMSFGTLHLGKAIADFMVEYPELQVQLTLEDRFIDPVAEGYDLTLRIARPQESPNLVSQIIAPIPRVLCASSSYLAKYGIPEHPEALTHHSCLHYGQIVTGNQWHLVSREGIENKINIKVNVKGVLCSNNGEVLKDAAIAGLGIALLPMFIIESAVKQGLLDVLDVNYQPQEIVLSLVYPLNRHLSTKIKVFSEFMRHKLQAYSL
jgi:DNA-binding transcriptional LysR family regulator